MRLVLRAVLYCVGVVAGLMMPQAAFGQVTYQYTGRPFTSFSCGADTDLCATPGPNANTSYSATDKVTATLTLPGALPPNLHSEEINYGNYAGFQITMNDGHQTLSATSNLNPLLQVSTDASGNITQWTVQVGIGGTFIYSSTDNPDYVIDEGQLSYVPPATFNTAANFNMAGTWVKQSSSPATAFTYYYVGQTFTYFSCGPTNGSAPLDCATPYYGGYTTSGKLTGTLTLAAPLASNLHLQDITGFSGYQASFNDGLQTLGANDSSFSKAQVSTDSAGNITEWYFNLFNPSLSTNPNIYVRNAPDYPSSPVVGDLAVLGTYIDSTSGLLGSNFAGNIAAGVWGPAVSTSAFTFGTATRVIQKGQYTNFDITTGDRNVAYTPGYTLSTETGSQAAQAKVSATGPTVGSWSETTNGEGAARGVAFFNYINSANVSQTIKINAVLDGEFNAAPFGLPTGPLKAGAAIHVFDATLFANALNASGVTASQFLLNDYPLATAMNPASVFQDLDTRLASARIGGAAIFPTGLYGQLLTPTLSASFTVAPQQVFTVVFDIATSSEYAELGGAIGGGDVDFLNTLAPAANLFTDVNGNPLTTIASVGSAPPVPPTAASISLTPPTTTNTVGTSQTVTANVMSSASGPLSGAIVQFSVTSGPNTGVVGGGQTDANGNASFTYTGSGGAGTDTIQAHVGSVVSNTVQSVWDAAATPPAGTAFIASQTPGPVRNNYGGFVGMEFTVGATPISVSSLGRFIVSGNSGNHLVKLVQANGTDVPNGSVTILTSGATAGTYQYVALSSPVTLLAGTSYFLVSQETMGGDQWYDYGSVNATSVGNVVGPTYTDSFGHYIAVTTLPGRSYVPVSFLYAPPTTSLAVSITSPVANGTISGVASIAVTTTGSVASLQVKVDGNAQGSPVPVSVNQGPNYTLSLDTTVLSIGTHSITVMASDAFGNTITSAAVSVTVSNSPGGSTPFVVAETPGSLRNNYTGFVGLALNVGSTPVVVTSLGRFAVMGNSGTHLLKLVNSNGTDVPGGSVSVSMSGSTPGTFQYASLPAGPFTLQANTSYYLVSQETAGGDMWHDYGSVVTSVVASVPGPVYTDSLNHYVTVGGLGGESYVPVSFLYGPTANTISAAITSPQSGALLSGKSVSVTVSTTGTVTSLQLQVDGVNQGAAVSASPLTLDSTLLTNGQHTLTVVASQGSVASAVSPGVSVTVDNGGSTPASFTTGQTSSTLRNNYTGYVGMTIQVGATPLSVTSLGRYVVSGDSGTHAVKLVQANGTDVPGGSVSLSLSGATAGQYAYATLANPVALLANTTYYLVSQETSGGDKWYDLEPITTTGVGKVTGPTYVDGMGHYVTVSGYPGYSYVPVSFLYQ